MDKPYWPRENRVYLEASADPNLRGVLVEVDVDNPGAADALLAGQGLLHTEAGTVTNAGNVSKVDGIKGDGIFADRGNITLVGFAVNQQGRLSATTSVTENGSIKLLARYNVSQDAAATYNVAASVANSKLLTTYGQPRPARLRWQQEA